MVGTAFDGNAATAIADALNRLLADSFALYLKTKNFHWHMSGPPSRDYPLLLDEQAAQILATTDPLAERVRKLGAPTLRSIGGIRRLQRIADNDSDHVSASAMLVELHADNRALAASMRLAHEICAECGDVASTSLLEVWVDEAEQRAWFLAETAAAS
jgi:starvation-inducible DNA-binding protein